MKGLIPWLLLASLLALVVACGEEEMDPTGASVAVNLYALEGTCSSQANTEAPVLYKVTVVSKAGNGVEVLADKEFDATSTTLKLGKIPEGSDIELTILGVGANPAAAPLYFGRAKNLTVTQDETTNVDLTWARYGDVSCGMKRPSGAPNMLFPTSTTLPDGRVLLAGGFTKVVEETGRFEIGQASSRGYIYDPVVGELTQVGNEMNKARGAHAAIYLPKAKLILLVGGTERMYMEKDNTCFPFYFLKDKAGTVGFTYELFDITTEKFVKWDAADWPDQGNELNKKARRIFPGVSLNNDGTVLVTGGGTWPSCQTKTESDSDYQIAELYRPKSDNYSGMFMESYGALTMKAMRSGHSAVLLDVKDKRATHIFWGGTEDGPIAELYTEASGQMDGTFGVFTAVEFLDANAYKKRPYFHTMTPLRDRKFLLAGGSLVKNGDLSVPSAGDAHLLDIQSNNNIAVSAVEGLGFGRYFHSAATYDSDNVVVFGGFSSVVQGENTLFADTALEDMRFFNLTDKEFVLPSVDAVPASRAGHIAAPLPDDCLLLLGGVDLVYEGIEFGANTKPLYMEVFCPSAVCPESLWETTCYQE
jgi:hypothetical protein